jgi:cytochrome P450
MHPDRLDVIRQDCPHLAYGHGARLTAKPVAW